MKKVYVIALMVAAILSGCTKEPILESNSDGDKVLVHLNLSGEINVEEMPLTKAFSTNDLIGVQVYQGSDYYAYGLFDDVSNMNIYLHTGKTYKFVCSVVKNGKSLVYEATNSSVSTKSIPVGATSSTSTVYYVSGQYLLPFIAKDGHLCSRPLSNHFNYSSSVYFTNLQYGRLSTSLNSHLKYPQADRFYGEVSGFTPSDGNALSIPMKRVSFGISLSVSGITDGNVTVTIKNSDQTFHSNSGITQDTQFGATTWSFFDLKSAWQYADNYAENFTVGVVWNRGVGVTQNLGTKTVQFKRNAINRVNINLGTSTKSSGLAITLEEPEITNETYYFGN
jgi:hypothetical protein